MRPLSLSDILRRVRSRLDDSLTPYLWPDEELIDYTNDAIQEACIRANLDVQDEVAIPFTQKLDLTFNNKYALPSSTLYVRSVRLASSPGVTLCPTSLGRIEQQTHGRPIGTGTPGSYATDQTQDGRGNQCGIRVRTLYLIPTPAATDTALVDVVRVPCDLQNDSDVPEIDSLWHSDLIYGITALAYLKRDTDTFDPKKYERDWAVFEERFGPRLPAVVIRERQTDVPRQIMVY